MKKFYQILLLIFTCFSSTFGFNFCKRGGSCAVRFDPSSGQYVAQEPAGLGDDLCYYYKCKIGQWMFLEGSGTYDDFVNACKYVDPQIKKGIKEYNFHYMHTDHELILVVCHKDAQERCQNIFSDVESNLKIHKHFDYKIDSAPTAFTHERVETCAYNNTPLAKLPRVQCDTGGICQAGNYFGLYEFERANFTTKTCDACLLFVCTVDGKKIIEGSGCYDDFVKACNNTNPNAVARFKEKTIDKEEGIKSNFYYDNSMIVASCSDADNCHKYAFDYYMNNKVFNNFYYDENAKELCSYEEMIEEPTTAPSAAYQQSGGITLMLFFFGIYLLLALSY